MRISLPSAIPGTWRRTLPVLLLPLLVLASAPLQAQTRPGAPGPAPAAAAPAAAPGFSALARRVMPGVVGIAARRDIPGAPRDGAHSGMGGVSTGSGFVIDAQGIIVTNNHVVEGASAFEVTFSSGATRAATLVGRDPETDLAVLRLAPGGPVTALPWGDSDRIEVGDWAIAIGSPFGLGNSLSVGVISGRNRDLQAGRYDDFLQTDAAINRGNSGGPLFDSAGRVIGVNTAIVSPGGAQGGSVGVGFAVPANQARRIVAALIRDGVVRRGWIGLRARPAGDDEAAGIVVTEVAPGSPAARAGLRPGDRLTRFAGAALPDPRALARAVADSPAGRAVRIDGLRGRQAIFANVTVGRTPGEQPATAAASAPPAATAALGLSLRGADAAEQRRLPAGVRVVISGVDPFGPGRGVAEAGDGLMEVQGRPVATPGEARAALEAAARQRDAVVVRLWRDGDSVYRALRSPRR